MVEQGTHKPLDVGSNPTLATDSHYFEDAQRKPRLTFQ
jgi:hypothetical protein